MDRRLARLSLLALRTRSHIAALVIGGPADATASGALALRVQDMVESVPVTLTTAPPFRLFEAFFVALRVTVGNTVDDASDSGSGTADTRCIFRHAHNRMDLHYRNGMHRVNERHHAI
ncbi:hypothetical protein GGX14DRAFT_471082, partial [Mycena pura]